jgi:DNA modification methylase
MKINTIIQGDTLTELKKLPDESIDCCITSPPYWTQRFYGGGENEIGLEKTPERYIKDLFIVFKELKRVLKKSGTFWLNIDDVYYGSGHGKADDLTGSKQGTIKGMSDKNMRSFFNKQRNLPHNFLKKKDLCLIPFRLIDKLQKDGWYIRNCIIWYKPNAMPENVKDRFVNDYEFLFLLTKSYKYYFKQILEPYLQKLNRWGGIINREIETNKYKQMARKRSYRPNQNGRLKRSVWSINTSGWRDITEHVAPFPQELIDPLIKAGCPEKGLILDPFMGSGTTAIVAKRNKCNWLGIELNPDYVKIANKRINNEPEPLL